MLPAIPVSISIPPDTAIQQRHPVEEARFALQSNARAAAGSFSPHDATNGDEHEAVTDSNGELATEHGVIGGEASEAFHPNQSLSFLLLVKRVLHYPRNQKELVVTIMLGAVSLILFAYGMMVLYKCMCPRNYAKWRTSGWGSGRHARAKNKKSPYYKQIRESVPLVLEGHLQVSLFSLVTFF